jgi:hypothetical protein
VDGGGYNYGKICRKEKSHNKTENKRTASGQSCSFQGTALTKKEQKYPSGFYKTTFTLPEGSTPK